MTDFTTDIYMRVAENVGDTRADIEFDEAMHRGTMYRDFEAHAREESCNLLNKEVK